MAVPPEGSAGVKSSASVKPVQGRARVPSGGTGGGSGGKVVVLLLLAGVAAASLTVHSGAMVPARDRRAASSEEIMERPGFERKSE